MNLLQWTGHPFADVGIATLCAMVDKLDPRDLTLEDLDQAAREMNQWYFSGLMTSYLTCVFMNAEYVQPGTGPKKTETRKRYAQRVLFAHRSEPDPDAAGQTCAFSGHSATHLIHRGQMPLLTGEDVLNFFPAGIGALPVAGPYLTALQALPLGGRRTEGKLLIAHSDLDIVTLELAKTYLADNRRLLSLAKLGALPAKQGAHPALTREQAAWDAAHKRPKYPDAKSASSLITHDLIRVWEEKQWTSQQLGQASVTVYWLSSSGQGPSLDIYHLPSNLLRFLVLAGAAETKAQWRRIVARGWQEPRKAEQAEPAATTPRKRVSAKIPAARVPGGPGRSRNEVLTDLFSVYQNGFVDLRCAQRFLRRHILSELHGKLYHCEECDWLLAELFLREVFGMDQGRIDAIRSFADRLAEHIRSRNDQRLFRDIVIKADKQWEFRNALVKAQRNAARDKNQLLFGLDDYLRVFEAEESVGRLEWGLVRDLISIRLVEQLQKAGFLSKEMLGEEEQAEEQLIG